MQDPIQKLTNAKRVVGAVQVAEYLPSKHPTLSSNPNATEGKKICYTVLFNV
jgi:hypothetical protein